VGSRETLRFSGRVLAATNHDLRALRQSGQFREDFYYRLCSDEIHVPSLRERLQEDPGELSRIVRELLKRIIGEGASAFSSEIEHRLHAGLPGDYAWPGNVRELEQAIRRICLTGVYHGQQKSSMPTWTNRLQEPEPTAQDLLASYCRELYSRHGSYVEVARITALDRRTVKKYVG
jgi:DNA-binding NtrC family response regulator